MTNKLTSEVQAIVAEPAGETVTLTRQQLDHMLRAAYPFSTASERANGVNAALSAALSPNTADAPLPEFPAIGSLWRHKNGNLYRVTDITNVETARQDEYPTSVIYRNVNNGKAYSRKLVRWHGWMTLVEDAAVPASGGVDIETLAIGLVKRRAILPPDRRPILTP